jgi:hypothetical protein
MTTFTYDNGFCKTEVPLISDAHGIKRFMWGRHLTKTGLAEKTVLTRTPGGYAGLTIEVELPRGYTVPQIKVSGGITSPEDALLLAEHLRRVAAKVQEFTRPETAEELEAILAVQQRELATT